MKNKLKVSKLLDKTIIIWFLLLSFNSGIIRRIPFINKSPKDKYANPRNFAAGSIRQLSSAEAASRDLSFIAWDLIKGCDDIDFFFWRLEKLDDWGFTTVPRVGDAETVEDQIKVTFTPHAFNADGTDWTTNTIDHYKLVVKNKNN